MVLKKKTELKVKIIRVTDYYQRVVEEFGRDNVFKNALALAYTENEILDKYERKGEIYLIVK